MIKAKQKLHIRTIALVLVMVLAVTSTHLLAHTGTAAGFRFDIFNNGDGGSPSRPNASLEAAGIIRMWTQLNGVGVQLPLAVADTIEALDQNGDCAMDFVRIGRVWQPGGFINYFNLLDVDKNGGAWQTITLTITVSGEEHAVTLVNSKFVPPVVLLVPQFLTGVTADDLSVVIFDGMLPWATTVANMSNPAWNPPGGIARLAFDTELGGFPITEGGWFTLFHHGEGFYNVQTYFYVPVSYFADGGSSKNVIIENTLRSRLISTYAPSAAAPSARFVDRHQYEQHVPGGIVRLPSICDRYSPYGNMTIAAAQRDSSGNRLPGQTWALGSPIAPWSGPGHFQTPTFRNQIFCDDTGLLIGLHDPNRALHMWTTHTEMNEFIHDLNQGHLNSGNMYVFNAGFGPHDFGHIADPFYFQTYFAVLTTTDLSGVDCWAEAGALVRANGRPTIWLQSNGHGNEHTSTDQILAILHSAVTTQWGVDAVRDINIVVYPAVNAAGRVHFRRETSNSLNFTEGRYGQRRVDGNRDWIIHGSQEVAQAAQVWHAFLPHVSNDAHEIGTWNYNAAGQFSASAGRADDIQTALHISPDVDDRILALGTDMMVRTFTDSKDAGIRAWYYDVAIQNASNASYYFGMFGGIGFITETRGQSTGLDIRRVYAGYVTFRSMIEFMLEDPALIYNTVAEVRNCFIERGRTYDPTDMFTLWHTNGSNSPASQGLPIQPDMRLPVMPRWTIYLTGGYSYIASERMRRHDILRERSHPTGYVVPLEIDWDTHSLAGGNWGRTWDNGESIGNAAGTHKDYAAAIDRLFRLLHNHHIEYYIIEAGATFPLSQYFVTTPNQPNAMARGFGVDLRAQADITFDVPVVFIPMDQARRTMVAIVMEPDMERAAEVNWEGSLNAENSGSHVNSWLQSLIFNFRNPVFHSNPAFNYSRTLIHCPTTLNLPIFRLTEDNPRDFVPVAVPVLTTTVYAEDWRETINIRFFLDDVLSELPLEDIVFIVDGVEVDNIRDYTVNVADWQTTTAAVFINKLADWQHIIVHISAYGQTVTHEFNNNMFVEPTVPVLTTTVYAEDWRETINIRFFLDDVLSELPLEDIAFIVDGVEAANIRDYTVNVADWQTTTAAAFINKLVNWQHMIVHISAYSQTVTHEFNNNMFVG